MTDLHPDPDSSLRAPRRQLLWMCVIAMVLYLFWWLPPIAARQDAVFRSFAPLVAVQAHIHKRFVEPIDDDRLVMGAIRGMIGELDPYSVYMPPQQYLDFMQRPAEGYVGIGIQVDVDAATNQLVIIGPTDDSPAFDAGVRIGDVIVEIAGQKVSRVMPFESTQRLHGLEGSYAHFTVERPPDHQRLEFAVKRRRIPTRSVAGFLRLPGDTWDYMLDRPRGIGYICVREFWEQTASSFNEAVDSLVAGGLRGLVLDLRFNPGGDMHACLKIADRFIGSGVLLTTRNRLAVESASEASAADDLPSFPVVVLINGSSASGAEIVAGILQHYRRAVVVGERSFGKGSVQTLIPMEDGDSALRLTTAYYYLPDGRCIHRRHDMDEEAPWGIRPDITVVLSNQEETDLYQEMNRMRRPVSDDNPPRQIAADRQLAAALKLLVEQLDAGTAGAAAQGGQAQ
jgi:carboxyl-terminal processing protease